MAEIKEKHPTWFKMRSERRQLVKELPAETTAKVLLACWDYLETAEIPSELDPMERIAFSAFFPDLEESWRLYEQRIKAKNAPNSGKNSPCIDRYHTMPHGGEKESDQEGDERKRREGEEDSLAPASKNFSGDQRVYDHDSNAYELAEYFAKEKLVDFPGRAQPTERDLQKWAQALQELHEENRVEWDIVDGAMRFALDNEWWSKRVQSIFDFKNNFNKIFAEAIQERGYIPES